MIHFAAPSLASRVRIVTMSRSAIILVIDRLGAGALGPYGNTLLETPAWNRLAGESLLIEQALADAVDLPTAYRSYWRGIPAWGRDENEKSLAAEAQASGVKRVILTDEPALAELPAADEWDEI